MPPQDLLSAVRTIPDFPKPGIMFRDITTVLKSGPLLARTVDLLYERYRSTGIDKVVGVEARGFVIGGALAYRLGAGFVPARKPGKLPAKTLRETYALEYGTDAVEIHADAISEGERVLMHDDLLATGGTMVAACRLVERLGGRIAGVCFLIELTPLKGRDRLRGHDIFSLIQYDTD
ncbi:MAG TPA: adenine phosphoribosyltransferase [Bacteroidota bacterium]|nr:adenine phosphoribosyltransferase [Bacteroidota bacterium]